MTRLFVLAWAAMFVLGIVLGLPGAVLGLPDVAHRLDLSLVSRGTLISSLFLGLLAGSALSGPIVDRFGRRRVLAGSSALVSVCLAAFPLAWSAPVAAVALVALGLSSAGINTAANALVSELFTESRGRRMNMISLAVGLGGLTLSAGAAATAGRLPWQAMVFGSAVVAAGVSLAAAVTRDARADESLASSGPLFPASLRHRTFGLLGVLIMLCAANEASMAGWTSAYLAGAGMSPAVSTWALAGHWAGLILGRLLLGGHVEQRKELAIGLAGLVAAVAVVLMAATRAPLLMAAWPLLIGVAIAIITPTTLALAGDRFPLSPGTVFGVLLTLAQAGAMIAPAAIGVLAERAGLRTAILLLSVNNIAIVWLAWRLMRTRTRRID